MRKSVSIAIWIFFLVSVLQAHAYIVVLKNGKTMTGTLVSETTDTIVFKDDHGIQYSLKKSSFDQAKMDAANKKAEEAAAAAAAAAAVPPAPAAPEAAPAAAEKPAAPVAKKPGRTYTSADIDKLKEKLGELSMTQASTDAQSGPLATGIHSTEDFVQAMHQVGGNMKNIVDDMRTFGSSLESAVEFASSTGKPAQKALATYMTSPGGVSLRKQIDTELADLESAKMQINGAPKGYEATYQSFQQASQQLDSLWSYLQKPDIENSTSLFHSRFIELSNSVYNLIGQMQSISAAETPPPAPAPASDQQQAKPAQPADDQNQTQTPPQ